MKEELGLPVFRAETPVTRPPVKNDAGRVWVGGGWKM